MIIHLSNKHWSSLQLTGNKVLHDLHNILHHQHLTESWTIFYQKKAFHLCQTLIHDWNARIVRFQIMDELEALCPYLDNLAATITRAHLETLRHVALSTIEEPNH